jgi:hypothetical protein
MTLYDEADSAYAPMDQNEIAEEEIIRRAVLRLNGNILGFVLGTVAALVIFGATNWLVLKGGEVVGPHLGLLGQFFIGYSVSFAGSLIGALYGFLTGYLSGLFVGWVYNTVLFFRRR